MPWPPDIKWHRYEETKSGRYVPSIKAHLRYGGPEFLRIFTVDTGATATVAPRSYLNGLMEWDETQVSDSGLLDAQGKPLAGIRLEIEFKLLFSPPIQPLQLQETIWFCKGVRHGLLGQSTMLEKVGAIFLNFPMTDGGRRFGLFPAPP